DGVTVIGDTAHVISVGATGVVAARGGRTVALVGLEDVIVVDTPDAVLVVSRDRAQDVKAVVDRIKASGRDDLT
ncbi:MAG TPA: mannose-1-phosphate guanylyltransferase, partial [Lapillicoccus sp.]